MRKTPFLLFITLLFCVSSALFITSKKDRVFFAKSECPFCDHNILNAQKFYEDDLVIALYTHKPIFPGHCLVIPKRHVERFEELSAAEVQHINQTIKKVDRAVSNVFNTSSYLLLQKNGREVGQTVPHVHFHYIPRKTGDDSGVKFVLKMFIVNALPPIKSSEMADVVKKLSSTI